MRNKPTLVFFVLLITAAPLLAHGPLKFVNGRWFDGNGFVNRTVYTVEGRFQSEYSGDIQETIDLHGACVIPPFADAHNHALGVPATLDADMLRFLRAGIFYVKNPNNIAEFTTEVRSRTGGPTHPDVRYSNGGLTASGGHPIQIYDFLATHNGVPGWSSASMADQAYVVVDSAGDLDRKWPMIERQHPDFLKLYLDHSEEFEKRRDDPAYYGKRGLNPALLPLIVERAHKAGLTTTVHVTTAADFHNAVAARSDEIAHLPLAPIDPADAEAAARQHTTVVTTTLSHRPDEGVADLFALHRSNLALLKRAGVNVVIGTDNGEKSAVDEALNVAAMKVYTPVELLRLWTRSTAEEVLPGRKVGRLEDGCEASFLVLEANPLTDLSAVRRIRMRVKQGHVIELPVELPSVAGALLPIVQQKGVDAALAEYERLSRISPATYDFSELQLNRLGYSLLKEERIDAAIRIFALNAKKFPHSANVWDSLGEACMLAGKHDEAVANYRKSLQLNPKNDNAVKMLEKLGAKP